MSPLALLHTAKWGSRSNGPPFALLVFAVVLLFAIPAFALSPAKTPTQYVHASFGTEAGLPQSSVHAIAQTPDGYLWIATQDGLARFDGLRFKVFSNRDTEAFRENLVSSLLVGRDGTLWVGTDGGTLLRYTAGRFERAPAVMGGSSGIRSMCEAPDGSLFVASLGSGLHRILGGSVTTYKKADGLPDDVVMAVACDRTGGVWVGTAAGLARLSNGRVTPLAGATDLGAIGALTQAGDNVLWVGTISGAVVQIENGKILRQFGRESGLPPTRVIALQVDRDGNLWIGNEGAAITRFRGAELATFGKAQGLTDEAVLALFEDREGSIWIGTEAGGLNVLKESRFVAWGVRDGLPSDDISSALELKDGTILFGAHNGLVRLAGGKITTYGPKDGFPEWVDALLEDDSGVWIGSMRGALHRYRQGRLERVPVDEGLPNEGSRSICRDSAGVIWAGAPRGRLLRFENGHWSQVDVPGVGTAILALSGDRTGGLWVGTYSEGVRHRSRDGTWSTITTAQGLSNDMVIGFHEDAEGAIWMATHGGLTRWKNGQLRAITARDGLYHDTVYQTVEDDDGYFWMCSDRGISKTPKSELDAFADGRANRVSYRSFGLADGMRSIECNNGSPSGSKGRDGRLYFATLGGALAIDPKAKSFGSSPPIVLEEVVANGTVAYAHGATAPAKGWLELAPGLKNLEFQYATPSFIDPTHVHARYRLTGFDRTWVEAGLRRTAYYTNLPPGQYRFEVSACNADLLCSETAATLELKLLPRFYETVWFWLATATTLILAAAGGVRYRIRQIEKANVELENRVRERTEQLRTALVALEEKDERIQGDLKQAEAFQRALLPSLPEDRALDFSAWYEPAEVVGGDIYDVAEVRDNVFRVFIADTTGHGVQASLRTIAIKTEYDRLKSTHATPGELLAALNQRLCDTYDGGVCGSA